MPGGGSCRLVADEQCTDKAGARCHCNVIEIAWDKLPGFDYLSKQWSELFEVRAAGIFWYNATVWAVHCYLAVERCADHAPPVFDEGDAGFIATRFKSETESHAA